MGSLDGAARVTVREVRLYERPVKFRLPFKFGAVTLTEAPQVFVRAKIAVDGIEAAGVAAELLAPKWFDKNPSLSNEDNFEQLRTSLRLAAGLYLDAADSAPAPAAFALHAELQPAHYRACATRGLNGLIASFGTALIDRAIIDAVCRSAGVSVFEAVRRNLLGITAHTTPDLYAEDLDGFLAGRPAPERIAVRHTVGMADAITEADIAERLDDGLPESLEAVVAAYGHRHFKLKVGGDVDADIDRLSRIAAVLDTIGEDYAVSLDGNEQFAGAGAVLTLVERIAATPRLARLWSSTLYIEQPIARARALAEPVHALAARKPVALDESDVDIGVFPVGRALGYAGISSKSCKGFYRALLNAARAAAWNRDAAGGRDASTGAAPPRYFMIAEDLTTQAGIAVQQDFALAALVGATHVERNGHHFVDGFAGAPEPEQRHFAEAHPDLYDFRDGRARLRIAGGHAALASLKAPGFASACAPNFTAMTEFSLGRAQS